MKERIASFLAAKMKEETEKNGITSDKLSRTRQVREKSGRWLFLLLLLGQNWLCQCCRGRIAKKKRRR